MKIRREIQHENIEDEVLALTSVVRPILEGLLYALKADIVAEVGGYENVKIKLLPRLYREGTGDCGICFEYAVHDAIRRNDDRVLNKINDAARLCNVPGTTPNSILFGLEKEGTVNVIDTAHEILTEESLLLYGRRGRPAKLKNYLSTISGAFKNRRTRPSLPTSIRGLWKADLFFGYTDSERWVATTVKINPNQLEGAEGLRIGIVPNRQGRTDRIRRDEFKNLVICPLDHDEDFMQCFYEAWRAVQAFLFSDAKVPSEQMLPIPAHRELCRILFERREYGVLEVVEAIAPFGQIGLMNTVETEVERTGLRGEASTDLLVAPTAKTTV